MKKLDFKKLIKEHLKRKASEYLYNYKENENRSKLSQLKAKSKFQFQKYLKSEKLSNKEKRLLFSLRTRMTNVKTNYKNKYKFNMHCVLCNDKNTEESEIHLISCPKIIENVDSNLDMKNAKYENIFSDNLDDQIQKIKIFDKILRAKHILMKKY